MANRPEDQPTGDYARETASGKGFVGITKDDPLWQNASRSMDFIAECYDKDTGGFNQLPGYIPTIAATRQALESLWWAHAELEITDAIPRLKQRHGENALEKTAQFISSKFQSQTEYKDGQPIEAGGFLDENDGVNRLTTPTTHEGLDVLFSLDRLVGQSGAIAKFEAEHPRAFTQMLNMVGNRWVQADGSNGAFSSVADAPRPDIWGTHSALEIIMLSTVHRFETNPDETRKWVRDVQQKTPQIFGYLRSAEIPNGGFGFVPDSRVQNILSVNQVAKIADRLFFFNHPTESEDFQAKRAFFAQHNFLKTIEDMSSSLDSFMDKETGLAIGFTITPEPKKPEPAVPTPTPLPPQPRRGFWNRFTHRS